MRDVDRIKTTQDLFAKLIDANKLKENSPQLVAKAFNSNQVYGLDYLVNVCKAVNMKLINQFTSPIMNGIDFSNNAIDFDQICDDLLDSVNLMNLQFTWQFQFFDYVYENIKAVEGEKSSKALLHITKQLLSFIESNSTQQKPRAMFFGAAKKNAQPQNKEEQLKLAVTLLEKIIENKKALVANIYSSTQYLQNEIA